jgi:diguanylate cyclase (GGDEF)-like protein
VSIDTFTLMAVATANLLCISFALPLVMGRDVHSAVKATQAFLLQLTLGWLLLTVSAYRPEPRALYVTLSVLSMVCMSASLVSFHRALTGWLGPRPGARAIRVLAVLMPLGYALSFSSYEIRVGWSNFLLAAMLLVLARATLLARRNSGRHWRLLLLLCLGTMAVLTATRGVLGAFFTAAYPSFLTPHPVNIASALGVNLTVVLGTVAILVAWRDEADQHLRTMANTDGLTGLLNRRGFTERAEAMFANARRYRQPLTVLMLDLDHFKQINDRHGHEGGDKALRLFAQILGESRRSGDLVGRLGGEEFCVLLPNTLRHTASGFDQRLRGKLHRMGPQALGFALDYSAGVAAMTDGDATLTGLLARADAALYEAKDGGRGRLLMGVSGSGQTVI